MEYEPKGKSESVDHKDRDSLNDQRNNLRVISSRLQNINRGMQKNNKTKHKGVFFGEKIKR